MSIGHRCNLCKQYIGFKGIYNNGFYIFNRYFKTKWEIPDKINRKLLIGHMHG